MVSSKERPPSLRRRGRLIALAAIDLPGASQRAAEVLSLPFTGEEPVEVYEAFLERKNGAKVLAVALKDKTLPADAAKIGIRMARSTARDTPELIDALTKAGKLTFGVRKLTADEMRQMIADISEHGNPGRGEVVYRRKDMVCQKCQLSVAAAAKSAPI